MSDAGLRAAWAGLATTIVFFIMVAVMCLNYWKHREGKPPF
jgi:hypothetical protein